MSRQRVGENAGAAQAAAPQGVKTIRVCWGEEVLQPVQYNGVRVGPLEVLVEVQPGEDPSEVYERTWAWLDALGREQYERKMTGFLGRLKDASQKARAKP